MKKVKELFVRRCVHNPLQVFVLLWLSIFISATAIAQTTSVQGGKKISPDLFGLFFEDIMDQEVGEALLTIK